MPPNPATTPPAGPPSGDPAGVYPHEPDELDRWYGTWEPLAPSGIGAFMAGFDRPWWIIGGWSIEAFTGVPRRHEDLDLSILACDAPAFRDFLGDRWTPWNVDDGWFRPFDHRFPDVRPDSQLWVRRDAHSPWVLDVPLTPDAGGRWTNKRDRRHTEDLDDVTWVAPDGLRYSRPEVALMFKAKSVRPKDRRDFEVTLPLLDDAARDWLRATVARIHPGHEWLGIL